MTVIERLQTKLAGLGLTALEARLESLLEQASKAEPSYADFLLDVVSAEADARRARYLKTRLQLAHLPYVKTFAQFDLGFQPSIDERQIRELQTLRFVHEASNVILLGPPGVGKTHLAVALAEAAIQAAPAPVLESSYAKPSPEPVPAEPVPDGRSSLEAEPASAPVPATEEIVPAASPG